MNKSHRKLAREKSVFAIYQWLLIDAKPEELHLFLKTSKTLRADEKAIEYATTMVDSVIAEYANYRLEISRYLKQGWTFNRLSYLEQAILLVACFEIKNQELEKNIIANEAVELAKKYCDENSYRFINGILSNVQ